MEVGSSRIGRVERGGESQKTTVRRRNTCRGGTGTQTVVTAGQREHSRVGERSLGTRPRWVACLDVESGPGGIIGSVAAGWFMCL
jgi:hypothetical protein